MNNKYTEEELYNLAKKRVASKKAFKIHFTVYILVSLLLTFISLSNGSFWFIFPIVGWGIGILAHKFALNSMLNNQDDVEEEFNRLKNKL